MTIVIPALIFKFLRSVPFVFEVRDLWPEVPIAMGIIKNKILIHMLLQIAKFSYKSADSIIALSPGMKDGILKLNPEARVEILTNMASPEIFLKSKFKNIKCFTNFEDKKIVLYAGTFGIVNNLDYVIRLAKHTKEQNIVFFLVGDGIEKEELINSAKKNGTLNENLFFFPPVAKADIPHYFNKSSAIISTTRPLKDLWQNSANKFFDAVAQKNR